MLEPRAPARGAALGSWCHKSGRKRGGANVRMGINYGICPTAWDVEQAGRKSVHFRNLTHCMPDANAIAAQIAFCIGEHHSNNDVDAFISSLYRYVGLDPDPPGEFDGFAGVHEGEDGFAIIEVNVKQPRTQ